MELNDFFIMLKLLNTKYLPKKKYPNAIYSNKYRSLSNIKKEFSSLDKEKKYMKYIDDNTNIVDYLCIEDELNYINLLNIPLRTPKHSKLYLEKYILEAIKVFDFVMQNHELINIEFIADIDDIYNNLIINTRKSEITNHKLYSTISFPNPIKRDIYISQFLYFIKIYIMFRFKDEKDKTLVPKKNFLNKVIESLNQYISSQNFNNEKYTLKKQLNDCFIYLQVPKG